jgi:hypothetical protein
LDDAPLTGFHKRLALYSSGGPFLDGYILSIIGVALVQITPQLGLGGTAEGLVGASALIGIFLGAFVGGWLTDKFGRKLLFTIDLIAIIVCSIAQFFVDSAVALIGLRLLIGMAVGADYPIATSLLAEFSPRKWRGPLLGAYVCMWFVGAAVAYIVGDLLQGGALVRRERHERPLTQAFERRHRAVPRAALRLVGGRPQPPVGPEVGVDPVRGAEATEAGDGVLGGTREPHRLVGSAQGLEAGEVMPERHREPAVAAAGPPSAHAGLDDGDTQRGIELLDAQRGPQAGVAAADDADIGAHATLERGARPVSPHGVGEPPASPRRVDRGGGLRARVGDRTTAHWFRSPHAALLPRRRQALCCITV